MPLFAPLTTHEMNALRSAPASSLPKRLSSLLQQNHTRVIDLFRSLDKNGDGEVTRSELAKALSDLGVSASKDELDDMFRNMVSEEHPVCWLALLPLLTPSHPHLNPTSTPPLVRWAVVHC